MISRALVLLLFSLITASAVDSDDGVLEVNKQVIRLEAPVNITLEDANRADLGCDRGGADNQKMTFFGRNFGTCSTMDKCLRAAMPIQMAYYCPKHGRPSCGGRCLSLIKGDCTDGLIRDKEGGTHNFKKDRRFWDTERLNWGFGTGRPMWPGNFGPHSCAYDYSSLFEAAAQLTKKFTYKKRKMKKCSWLAQLPQAAIEKICKTRIDMPAARVSCHMTCTGRDAASEANKEYLHRKKTRKTCDWLRSRSDRMKVCSSNKNARYHCAAECK